MSSTPSPSKTTHQTPRELAAAIKKKQEEALSNLQLNSLSIVLYIRADPPKPNDFHWAYYFHIKPSSGVKYHVSNLSGGWLAEHASKSAIFKEGFLCALVQIATVPEEAHARLDEIMRSHDGDINSIPGITCRVWLFAILKKLVDEGIVNCPSIEELQEECMEIGNRVSLDAARNVQPRPVVRSRFCN
ncbi:hypothetical protein N7474_009258 [Penicillium riverlandense]|uniref:uncharacterized protein n=1 Tax=Penicillium riverlandense TaxID=1903569 RepID=UPI0025470A62|nr:uncharacterized protein N7474_009258 [Penicillium riverlandense]KAJ5807989.1 hypothetical protein N7474_009258 [Penicillium riverlandense]